MKKLIILTLFSFLIIGCTPQKSSASNENPEMQPQKDDEGEWHLEVIDSQYDYFLNAIAKPENFYTESYLKSRNSFLVTEWNSIYFSGRNRNAIESSISYDPAENYGFEFEYRLYQVFAYVQWKYGLKLNGLSQTEIR